MIQQLVPLLLEWVWAFVSNQVGQPKIKNDSENERGAMMDWLKALGHAADPTPINSWAPARLDFIVVLKQLNFYMQFGYFPEKLMHVFI